MPITPTSAPSRAAPQNATPAAISPSSSAAGMYSSCQQSAGMTPRYASAASLMIAWITARSSGLQSRMTVIATMNVPTCPEEGEAARVVSE